MINCIQFGLKQPYFYYAKFYKNKWLPNKTAK